MHHKERDTNNFIRRKMSIGFDIQPTYLSYVADVLTGYHSCTSKLSEILFTYD